MRSLTKSPLTFVIMALEAGKQALPSYSHPKSPHTFTQPQLFAMLAFKEFMQLDYRGAAKVIAEWSDLRHAPGIKKIPHYSTLQRAQERLLKKTNLTPSSNVPLPSPNLRV